MPGLAGEHLDSDRPKKRRRLSSSPDPLLPNQGFELSRDSFDNFPTQESQRQREKLQFTGVKVPPLRNPKSQYAGWESPLPITSEKEAIEDLVEPFSISNTHLDYSSQREAEEDIYFTLSQFSIYRSEERIHGGNLVALHELKTQIGAAELKFDGVLERNGRRRWVQGVTFDVLSVSGYDLDHVTVADEIYIRSPAATKRNIWYHFGLPAEEYAPFHQGFLWLADFTKHFTCYLQQHTDVHLSDFTRDFSIWVHDQHNGSPAFDEWRSRYSSVDFRKVLAAHPRYLRGEACNSGVDHKGHNWSHPLWEEFDPDMLGAVPLQKYSLENPTLVTPYVADCFQDLYFADQLQAREPAHDHSQAYKAKWKDRLSWQSRLQHARAIPKTAVDQFGSQASVPEIRVGDIVGFPKEENGIWKSQGSTYYAYVHAIEIEQDSRRRLHVLWLYHPGDTICGTMRYPYQNELFFSDHCNCKCRKADRYYAEDVVSIPQVALFSGPIREDKGFFIRQTYVTDEAMNQFVTLEVAHLHCEHQLHESEPPAKYRSPPVPVQHSTVLVDLPGSSLLEPVEVIDTLDGSRVKIRQFLRKGDRYCTSAAPNELVLTDIVWTIPSWHIVRPCNIRIYSPVDIAAKAVPAPYCYGGTGDCWILSSCLDGDIVVGLDRSFVPSFTLGFDPTSLPPGISQLRALDLFCGSGALGRGIDDAGATRCDWAVDIDGSAIHTKKANSNMADESFFWGSAVHFMKLAMDGRYSRTIPAIGAVQMIIAGSPCGGFSFAQQDTQSAGSRRNASMVALVVAFIDLYRPEYALLENVFGMARPLGEKKDQQVLAQIICALVGMGYQVQCSQIEAANQGGPQTRTRIISSIAAPGLSPLDPLQPTHTTPGSNNRAICRTLNGERFGETTYSKAPFNFVSAQAGTKGLPDIGDALTGICMQDPDHRVSVQLKEKWRNIIPYIPRHPRGMGFAAAKRDGHIPAEMADRARQSKHVQWTDPKLNRAYRRVDPDQPFDTVMTACNPGDARTGKWIHWDHDRVITVAEARRAQSVPDHEVLIGTVGQQWKLVGNGVSRYVAASLGVKLREAWVRSNQVLGTLSRRPDAVNGVVTQIGDDLESVRVQPPGLPSLPAAAPKLAVRATADHGPQRVQSNDTAPQRNSMTQPLKLLGPQASGSAPRVNRHVPQLDGRPLRQADGNPSRSYDKTTQTQTHVSQLSGHFRNVNDTTPLLNGEARQPNNLVRQANSDASQLDSSTAQVKFHTHQSIDLARQVNRTGPLLNGNTKHEVHGTRTIYIIDDSDSDSDVFILPPADTTKWKTKERHAAPNSQRDTHHSQAKTVPARQNLHARDNVVLTSRGDQKLATETSTTVGSSFTCKTTLRTYTSTSTPRPASQPAPLSYQDNVAADDDTDDFFDALELL